MLKILIIIQLLVQLLQTPRVQMKSGKAMAVRRRKYTSQKGPASHWIAAPSETSEEMKVEESFLHSERKHDYSIKLQWFSYCGILCVHAVCKQLIHLCCAVLLSYQWRASRRLPRPWDWTGHSYSHRYKDPISLWLIAATDVFRFFIRFHFRIYCCD